MEKESPELHDVFVISDDVVGDKMAGPGIRAWELSKCLSKHFKVALAIPDYSSLNQKSPLFDNVSFYVIPYAVDNPRVIKETGEHSKIILVQGYILSKFPFIKELPAHLICDVYVPFPLENLFIHKWKIPSLKDREFVHLKDLQVFNDQMIHGDHFLCANARQRDLFVGSLLSLNRINPEYLDASPVLDELISIVPFGINPEDEESEGDALQNNFPQIKRDEENILLIWGGVISNWFDPATLIRSVSMALERNPKIQLLFLSTTHPNPLLPEFDMAKQAIRISDELGLTDKHVFFNSEWVEYAKRGAYFSGADIGVSIHKVHFETYYSFRTRILDYLKYDLPIICTKGDYFADLVGEKDLGIAVNPENDEELATAILDLADRGERTRIEQNIMEQKRPFFWENVSEPLVGYCRRVLSGETKQKNPASRKDIALLFSLGKKSAPKAFIKSTFWFLFQKLPIKLSTKLRRLLRF
jgi:glycosyltransferase involved in cell wall biosynthesis